MGMFDKYDKLNTNYVPDNTSPEQSNDYSTLKKDIPEVSYNILGRPIGMSWDYGSEFDLKFTANQTIKVDENSIIYTKSEEHPVNTTEGVAGQQAYNTVDCKSWTCVGVSGGLYIWVQDDEVIYSIDGSKEIQMSPDMENKEFIVEINNFRGELLYSDRITGTADICININKDLNQIFKPGIYYSVLKLQGEEDVIVRDRIMLIVR